MQSKIKNIDSIIKLLKEAVKNFNNPVATEIGEQTRSPFMVLVSCLLSLRAMDKITGRVSKKLFESAKTPQEIAKMPLKQLQNIIRPVNYYITKSKRVKQIAKDITEKYNGKVPDTFDELMRLNGVGRKTANIVMTYGFFKKDYIPIDTHCHRIPNRLGWIKTKTPEQTEFALMKILPKKYWKDFNDVFVAFGQNICLPASPLCSRCVISKYCPRIGVVRNR